jgi:hypothetical protein
MTDQVPNITSLPENIIPPKPSSTRQLEIEADMAIRYLEQFTSSSRLDPELRMALNDIKNTVKMLKSTVMQMSEAAQDSHDKLVEVVRSQRLTGN